MSDQRYLEQHSHDADGMSKPVDMFKPGLLPYLSAIRSRLFSYASVKITSTSQPTSLSLPSKNNETYSTALPVMGNSSCDLDSFVSATVLSYFLNINQDRGSILNGVKNQHYFLPLLNLPTTESNELWRLRPEFGVAVRGAVEGTDILGQAENAMKGPGSGNGRENREQVKSMLERLVTIADIRHKMGEEENRKGLKWDLRESSDGETQRKANNNNEQAAILSKGEEKTKVILVDHNVPSIFSISDEDVKHRFDVVGCVDHHVDEDFVKKGLNPRIVETGIGSCTSLVVKYLRDEGLWGARDTARVDEKKEEQDVTVQQMARLASAAILVDTANLKATGDKCSDTDRDAISFLDGWTGSRFDRDVYYDRISYAKSESLNLLTPQEIFDRDYKEWQEKTKKGSKEINLGMSSLVKDTKWLVSHAEGREHFAQAVSDFAVANNLGLLVLLTRTESGEKEVVCFSFCEEGKTALEKFEQRGRELRLTEWKEDNELLQVICQTSKIQYVQVWWMGDTSKSRKQVAPLLREALRDV